MISRQRKVEVINMVAAVLDAEDRTWVFDPDQGQMTLIDDSDPGNTVPFIDAPIEIATLKEAEEWLIKEEIFTTYEEIDWTWVRPEELDDKEN